MWRIYGLLVLFLTGCDSSDIPKPVPKTETAVPLFDAQRQVLTQSKQVQQQINQQADAQRQIIEQQTQ